MIYTVLAKRFRERPVQVRTRDPREALRQIREFREKLLYVVAHDETGTPVDLDDLVRIIQREDTEPRPPQH